MSILEKLAFHAPGGENASEPLQMCQRCKQNVAEVKSRREYVCSSCFNRFVRGKLRKALMSDKYKISYRNHTVHKVMLAYSGTITSVACLDMLVDLLEEQNNSHSGKQGFELTVVHIDDEDHLKVDKRVEDVLRQRLDGSPVDVKYKIVPVESFLDDKAIRRLNIDKQFNILVDTNEDKNQKYSLQEIMALIPSRSSQEDLLEVIYEDLLTSTAVQLGCGTIIYCSHLSNLASQVLAMVVKGRGPSISSKLQNHDVQSNGVSISIVTPLKDLYIQEIEYYLEVNNLNQYVANSVAPISNISKNMTVKQITSRYIRQVEDAGYTSTPSTVVKTSEKLVEPSRFLDTSACIICHNTIFQDPKSWLTRITVNDEEPLTTREELDYKEEYDEFARTMKQIDSNFHKSPLSVCYGCMVTMNGIKPDSGFLWPDKQVLDEYIIDSDDD